MKTKDLIELYQQDKKIRFITDQLNSQSSNQFQLKGLIGSASALLASSVFTETPFIYLMILSDKESAAYFYNDMESLFNENNFNFHKKKVLFYPSSYKRSNEIENIDNTNVLLRTEVLKKLGKGERKSIVVTYPEAICEKVVTKKYLEKNTIRLKRGEAVSIDFITDLLIEYEFERVDFVIEPGQFSIRGGIIDIFSFTNDYPYRIEFSGDEVESIRSFDTISQLSIDKLNHISIVADVHNRIQKETRESFLSYLPKSSVVWIEDVIFCADKITQEFEKAKKYFSEPNNETGQVATNELFITKNDFINDLQNFTIIEFGKHFYFNKAIIIDFDIQPQPSFNKNFNLLIENMNENTKNNINNIIISDNPTQLKRLYAIFDDTNLKNGYDKNFKSDSLKLSLHEGFIDKELKIACYTDHQIFERYHKFQLKDGFKTKESLTLKEIYNLNPGDYVTHIDHGIGIFDGLEKIENNGREQEAIRLIYKNNDLLYISIHSLHRISKYIGKEGSVPTLNRLGSNSWNKLKNKTKQKVKDIAKKLIKLYAERKSTEGFSFSTDTYLQHELEASFIYEDTRDQIKATNDIKKDMESGYPMDRLVCGDVGFGKTEIAIRAAFKTVAESKQVAVLVPTTILALQHYNTFQDRLAEFPCNIDYINRFKSTKAQKQILQNLKKGKIDIIIGTHRLVSKDIEFRDLGLLIIDEEQKFGVSTKEKLKQLKVNVDTLILTATPIPRTLQ
ncbi:MAG: DEAD/DEAH box helicase, partial [Bacteroidales bacterium]|nr:DEAD/DEAH box helicase [Bacteroidales bacterium]